ncbi:MAG: hypothetical protein LBN27_01980 [Prevotellaceae bacterium]|jgi:hypothetical protein|nr:hypothetical protein [Prevotellaceae bacterium]
MDYLLKYLKPEYYQEFFDANLKAECIENIDMIRKTLSSFRYKSEFFDKQSKELSKKLLDARLFETKEYNENWFMTTANRMYGNPVSHIMQTLYDGKYNCRPYFSESKFKDSMKKCLCSLIQSIEFKDGDFEYICKNLNYGGWFHKNFIYYTIISVKNYSAIKYFEKYFNFKPFILKKQRMYENIRFRVAIDNKWQYLKCTCFEPENDKIRFVTEYSEKQKKYCFTHKEFMNFFKELEVDFK